MAKTTVIPSANRPLSKYSSNSPPNEPSLIAYDQRPPKGSFTNTEKQPRVRRSDSNKAEQAVLFGLLSFCLDLEDAGKITGKLVESLGSFAEIVAAPECVLSRIEGVTVQTVALLKALEMAAQKLGEAHLKIQPILNNWVRLTEYLNLTMGRKRNEIVKVLFLNTKNGLIADEVLNEGDVNYVHMSCRKLLARAFELNSTAIILAHNHPSGNPIPSECDIEFTRDLCFAASYMGIIVHDHIVVGNGRYFSFRREGLLT